LKTPENKLVEIVFHLDQSFQEIVLKKSLIEENAFSLFFYKFVLGNVIIKSQSYKNNRGEQLRPRTMFKQFCLFWRKIIKALAGRIWPAYRTLPTKEFQA
jgi:hypothetical protein